MVELGCMRHSLQKSVTATFSPVALAKSLQGTSVAEDHERGLIEESVFDERATMKFFLFGAIMTFLVKIMALPTTPIKTTPTTNKGLLRGDLPPLSLMIRPD